MPETRKEFFESHRLLNDDTVDVGHKYMRSNVFTFGILALLLIGVMKPPFIMTKCNENIQSTKVSPGWLLMTSGLSTAIFYGYQYGLC